MTKWIELNMPYGKKHIHKTLEMVTIEQYRDGSCKLWTEEAIKDLVPAEFKNLRAARKYIKENME